MRETTRTRLIDAACIAFAVIVLVIIATSLTGCSGGGGGGPFGWMKGLFGGGNQPATEEPTPASTLSWLPGLGFLTTAAGIAMVAISRGASGVGWTLIALGIATPLLLWVVHAFIVPTLVLLACLTATAIVLKLIGKDVDLRGLKSWIGSLHTRLHSLSGSSRARSSGTSSSTES